MTIEELIEQANANRLDDLDRLARDGAPLGDFEGSVTGRWVKLGQYAEGIVQYKNKQYSTKPIGFVSLPPGTEVELSYASGVYYSKF